MKDRNCVEITVGATVVLLDPHPDWLGKVGTVNAIVPRANGTLGARVLGGLSDDPDPAWGAWCRPSDIAVAASAAGLSEGKETT